MGDGRRLANSHLSRHGRRPTDGHLPVGCRLPIDGCRVGDGQLPHKVQIEVIPEVSTRACVTLPMEGPAAEEQLGSHAASESAAELETRGPEKVFQLCVPRP